jgi:endonuclease/exonuclease/phosphatase family metal-dependent hydrolase
MRPLRIVSYNIHKGFTAANLGFVLKRIKASIEEVEADLVLLQEVLGHHEVHGSKIEDWPTTSQFEYLADKLWPHFAYGKNAVYTEGHHGNAILSKFPITFWENQDVSLNQLERRGLLHAVIDIPGVHPPLHAICVHLGLLENDRLAQVERLGERIAGMVPGNAPLIVGGDFNDWREKLSPILKSELGLEEAFLLRTGSHARTFPSWFPALKLDRLYFRGIECRSALLAESKTWRELSDHLPIIAEFGIEAEGAPGDSATAQKGRAR